jgi:hypothetical protein
LEEATNDISTAIHIPKDMMGNWYDLDMVDLDSYVL